MSRRPRITGVTKNMFWEHPIDMPAGIAVDNIKIRPAIWVLLPTIGSDKVMDTLGFTLGTFWLSHPISFLLLQHIRHDHGIVY